jgi:hypothetical protein
MVGSLSLWGHIMKTLAGMCLILIVAAVIGWQFGLVPRGPGWVLIPILLLVEIITRLLKGRKLKFPWSKRS